MSAVGRINLDLGINTSSFNKQVDGIQKHASGKFNAMSVAFGNIVAQMAQKAVGAIGRFFKNSIAEGSRLNEVENVVDNVFRTMSQSVDSFSNNALKQFGLTEFQAKKMLGTFGAMSRSFGFTEAEAFNMSSQLAGLAGDVASFYDSSVDEAYGRLKGVFTGETESLKELGVVMTQEALNEFALAQGINRTTESMSQQEKVALRLAFVQDRLAIASGDVVRTQDQWANQMRYLAGQFQAFQAALGDGLISVLSPLLSWLNNLLTRMVQVAKMFSILMRILTGRGTDTGAAGAMKEVASATASAGGSAGALADGAERTAKAAKDAVDALMGFDEINNLVGADPADSGGGSGGGGGGGGFGGAAFDDSWADDSSDETYLSELEASVRAWLDRIKPTLQPLIDSWGRLKESFKPLAENLGAAVKWIYDEVIVPIGKWVISALIPAFFDTLGTALEAVNGVLELLKPVWKWFWDNVLKPLATWTGGRIIAIWEDLSFQIDEFSLAIDRLWKFIEVVWGAGVEFLKKACEDIATFGKKLWDNLKTWASDSISGIMTAWSGVGTWFTNIWTTIKNAWGTAGTWFTTLFAGAWTGIKNSWAGVTGWFGSMWSGIKGAFFDTVSWFGGIFGSAWTAIKGVFAPVGSFFSGVWTTITSVFKSVGFAIGDAIGGAFRSVVNGVVGFAENTINDLVKTINWAIDGVNKLPGVNISHLSSVRFTKMSAPSASSGSGKYQMLATGGLVRQPTLAMVGEAGDEAVIPLDKDRGAIQQIADLLGSKMDSSGGGEAGELVVMMDGEVLLRALMNKVNKGRRQLGKPAIEF